MLRVAFIGAGQMAGHHVKALTRIGVPATVVGVHDRMAERAEELAALAGCQAFPTTDALLREARPDVVHVCTPPGAHFAAASVALEGGAHVYVEKPFALTLSEARALLDLARARGLLVCAGHQLLRDRAFEQLLARLPGIGRLVQVDSHFAFEGAGASVARRGAITLARQLVDILPHPLYSLVSVLERCAPEADRITMDWVHARPADVQAVLRAGDVIGRLSVSLRARPVASTLTLTGTRGALTCDFVRTIVVGPVNPGTEALEKVLNPIITGAELAARTVSSVWDRVRSSVSYPGLAELIEAFYQAVMARGASPVSPAHLLSVTDLFERLAARVDAAAFRTRPLRPEPQDVSRQRAAGATADATSTRPVVVTGARGFLGSEIARVLPRVRGIGRNGWPDAPHLQEWVAADLSTGLRPEALAGADVVVHAAAETAGGYAAHQRNTIDATRHLLHAMHEAGVSRLVLVSSLSVIRPPQTPWERQDEQTPRPTDPRPLGAYTWGKCLQEELVEREAAALGIAVRIVRPGALIDWREPSVPGLMGRRLFGRWHLALGRPGLPIAVCDVERCARAIAWCATNFEDAPPVVNLFDPTIATRGELIQRLRSRGWTGRPFWVPISVVALGFTVASAVLSRSSERQAAWSILRPRRFDPRVSMTLLETRQQDEAGRGVTESPGRVPATADGV